MYYRDTMQKRSEYVLQNIKILKFFMNFIITVTAYFMKVKLEIQMFICHFP